MGRLNSTGVDEVLTRKMRQLLERAFESPYESKGKGPIMSYEKFVQLLDADDAVAQKAIDIIVQDVFTRARSRKAAVEEARQYHQPTYSSVAAAAAARRDQIGEQARRAWHGEVPSLSQRLHGWRYLNAEESSNQRHGHHQHPNSSPSQGSEAAEYDAIIADAQRQVASPLPMLGLVPGQQESREQHLSPLFDSVDWPDLNPGTTWGHEITTSWSDSDSEYDDDTRVQLVERALSAIQTQRDTSRTNLTRLSTISAASGVPTTSASRHRIIQRLEQRRRDLMDRAEQQRSSASNTSNNRSYPSYFNTSFSRTANENTEANPPLNSDASIPVIIGGDFSNLPSTSGEVRPGSNSETTRTNFGPLQRNNSIRRSGFHSNRGEQSSPPNSTAAVGAANALLPRVTNRPVRTLQPRSPLSISRPINEPSDRSFFAPYFEHLARRQQLDTLFGRQGSSEIAPEHEALQGQPQNNQSFEEFSQLSRESDRIAREEERARQEQELESTASATITPGLPRFRFLSPSFDPMLSTSTMDGDAVNEILGSSSSVAGLGPISSSSSTPRVPHITPDGRRSIIPPRAPILSRRSFPLDSTTTSPAEVSSGSQAAPPAAATTGRLSAGQQPQRANSVPERGQVYRREEILSLAQFLDEDSLQVLRNDAS